MTQLLISVTSTEEARVALENGADIIDLKDPRAGALGALPFDQIETIAAYVNGQKPVSSTIGDIPMCAEDIYNRVCKLATAKIDYIKIGFFESDDYQSILNKLNFFALKGTKLIAVLFAEYEYPDILVDMIHQAGFHGLMLDTSQKDGKTFLYHRDLVSCKKFAEQVSKFEMSFGLAGSLQLQDVVIAKQLKPTYMGFRGGVCVDNQRESSLNAAKILAIRNAL